MLSACRNDLPTALYAASSCISTPERPRLSVRQPRRSSLGHSLPAVALPLPSRSSRAAGGSPSLSSSPCATRVSPLQHLATRSSSPPPARRALCRPICPRQHPRDVRSLVPPLVPGSCAPRTLLCRHAAMPPSRARPRAAEQVHGNARGEGGERGGKGREGEERGREDRGTYTRVLGPDSYAILLLTQRTHRPTYLHQAHTLELV